MQVTQELLDKDIAALNEQLRASIAQVNRIVGAIQGLEGIKRALNSEPGEKKEEIDGGQED